MLGQFDRVPKFVKKFADMKGLIEGAAKSYAEQVKDRSFPGEANTYKFTKK